jgi:hypothetical protein
VPRRRGIAIASTICGSRSADRARLGQHFLNRCYPHAAFHPTSSCRAACRPHP